MLPTQDTKRSLKPSPLVDDSLDVRVESVTTPTPTPQKAVTTPPKQEVKQEGQTEVQPTPAKLVSVEVELPHGDIVTLYDVPETTVNSPKAEKELSRAAMSGWLDRREEEDAKDYLKRIQPYKTEHKAAVAQFEGKILQNENKIKKGEIAFNPALVGNERNAGMSHMKKLDSFLTGDIDPEVKQLAEREWEKAYEYDRKNNNAFQRGARIAKDTSDTLLSVRGATDAAKNVGSMVVGAVKAPLNLAEATGEFVGNSIASWILGVPTDEDTVKKANTVSEATAKGAIYGITDLGVLALNATSTLGNIPLEIISPSTAAWVASGKQKANLGYEESASEVGTKTDKEQFEGARFLSGAVVPVGGAVSKIAKIAEGTGKAATIAQDALKAHEMLTQGVSKAIRVPVGAATELATAPLAREGAKAGTALAAAGGNPLHAAAYYLAGKSRYLGGIMNKIDPTFSKANKLAGEYRLTEKGTSFLRNATNVVDEDIKLFVKQLENPELNETQIGAIKKAIDERIKAKRILNTALAISPKQGLTKAMADGIVGAMEGGIMNASLALTGLATKTDISDDVFMGTAIGFGASTLGGSLAAEAKNKDVLKIKEAKKLTTDADTRRGKNVELAKEEVLKTQKERELEAQRKIEDDLAAEEEGTAAQFDALVEEQGKLKEAYEISEDARLNKETLDRLNKDMVGYKNVRDRAKKQKALAEKEAAKAVTNAQEQELAKAKFELEKRRLELARRKLDAAEKKQAELEASIDKQSTQVQDVAEAQVALENARDSVAESTFKQESDNMAAESGIEVESPVVGEQATTAVKQATDSDVLAVQNVANKLATTPPAPVEPSPVSVAPAEASPAVVTPTTPREAMLKQLNDTIQTEINNGSTIQDAITKTKTELGNTPETFEARKALSDIEAEATGTPLEGLPKGIKANAAVLGDGYIPVKLPDGTYAKVIRTESGTWHRLPLNAADQVKMQAKFSTAKLVEKTNKVVKDPKATKEQKTAAKAGLKEKAGEALRLIGETEAEMGAVRTTKTKAEEIQAEIARVTEQAPRNVSPDPEVSLRKLVFEVPDSEVAAIRKALPEEMHREFDRVLEEAKFEAENSPGSPLAAIAEAKIPVLPTKQKKPRAPKKAKAAPVDVEPTKPSNPDYSYVKEALPDGSEISTVTGKNGKYILQGSNIYDYTTKKKLSKFGITGESSGLKGEDLAVAVIKDYESKSAK